MKQETMLAGLSAHPKPLLDCPLLTKYKCRDLQVYDEVKMLYQYAWDFIVYVMSEGKVVMRS